MFSQDLLCCRRGVGVETILNSMRAADRIVAIDGCDTDCAAKLLRKAGFENLHHIRVTDLGFEKGSSPVAGEAVERVAAEILALVRIGEG